MIGSSGLTIQGNLVGTDATGTKALPNKTAGILISGPTNVTIGGSVAGARNIVSGNTGDGIATRFGAAGLVIQGNYSGVGIDGSQPLGNGGAGIDVTSTGVSVGGLGAGQGNIVANNGGVGPFNRSGVIVTVAATPVLSNSIYNNHKLGIELQNGNNGQVAPVLISANSMNTTSTVVGSLTSASGNYIVQFFATPSLNFSGNAEGAVAAGHADGDGGGRVGQLQPDTPFGVRPGQ